MRAALSFLLAASQMLAADLSGVWVAEITGPGDPQYARVVLKSEGPKLTGTWGSGTLEGSEDAGRLSLSLRRGGTLKGTLTGASYAGDGDIAGGRGGQMQHVSWKLTRLAQHSGGPKTVDFEPKEFSGYYSAAVPPVLRVFPGDTIRTRTYDGGGADKDKHSPGANPETGPFYIEGALPGDTLVVKLTKVRVNRDSARQGNRINGRTVTPAFVAAAHYDPAFDSEWKLDLEKNVAMLAHPTERMKNFRVPILPMIGCIATAPAGRLAYRGTDLGPYGGNMDYNQMVEGATLYLPVYHPGALLFLGDGHAAMGDGELTGSALETSLNVELTVDVVKDMQTANPRVENADYLMSMGVAGSVPDSIQLATSQLADWLKADYKLNDNEVAVLLGAILKYDITEMVDSQFNVVAKVPKSALVGLR